MRTVTTVLRRPRPATRTQTVTGVSASVFQSAGDAADLPNRSQIVVVGAGIVGSSLAYHLRVEAGLRRAGLDSGPASNPLIAGFGHLVDLDKAQDFRGKDRLGAATAGPNARRPASIHLLDPARLLRGGEVVVRDGVVVGQVTSAAYGHGIGVACGLALIDRNLATGVDYSVDTADGLVAARVVDVGRSEEIESATGLA